MLFNNALHFGSRCITQRLFLELKGPGTSPLPDVEQIMNVRNNFAYLREEAFMTRSTDISITVSLWIIKEVDMENGARQRRGYQGYRAR